MRWELLLHASVSGSFPVPGSGTDTIFRRDLFEKRIQIVKETHNSEEVLNGLQVAVARLAHPPSE